MKIEMMPVISIYDLEAALLAQYDIDWTGELASFLFGDSYVNDSYKSFWFAEMDEYTGKPWQDEESIRVENCVKSILQDALPGYDRCLIDVSW